jgi:hypothetical protein
MTGRVARGAEKIGEWVRRFLSEVIASVVTTACVAGATTLYLHYSAVSDAPQAAVKTATIAPLLSPVADPAAVHFVPKSEPSEKAKPQALPPARPKAPKPAQQQAAQQRRDAEPQPAPAKVDLFAPPIVPVEAAAAFEPTLDPPTIEGNGTPRLFDPPRQANAASPSTVAALPPANGPHAERRLLGLPVPDAMPSGDDFARGIRGLGQAMGSLIP